MQVTRPLAHKLQEGITVIVGLLEMDQVDRAKVALLALSKLIADQTTKTISTSE